MACNLCVNIFGKLQSKQVTQSNRNSNSRQKEKNREAIIMNLDVLMSLKIIWNE